MILKLKNFIRNSDIINLVIIVFLILILTLLLGNHHMSILSDRGREFLIPQEILNGQVPYKDITLIYFPLGFYINALLYKLFGVSIDTLLISQMFLSILYMLGFYFLSKEFLSKTTSLLLTILVIVSCIFACNDLFSFIVPYSYTRAYGIFASFLSVFCFIKLFKTDNLKYLYIASIAVGFAISCKLEFFTTVILFIAGLILYKKLSVKQYFKIFFVCLIFPIITCGILFLQGVSLQNIIDSIKFGIDFAGTDVMTNFLSTAGVYPIKFTENLKILAKYLPIFVMIILLAFGGLKLNTMFSKKYFVPLFGIIILYYYCDIYSICFYWLSIPYIIAIIFVYKFNDNFINNRAIFFILLASLLLGQREFFRLTLDYYGTYSFPLYILSLIVCIKLCVPIYLSGVEVRKLINFIFILLICMYSNNLYKLRDNTTAYMDTSKGILYTNENYAFVLNNAIEYINNNIDKKSTILTLPEGTLINYLTDRKVDMHCFMMDRLYHDAYGEEKAKNLIESTNNDYILLFRGFDLNNFHHPYLFDPLSSSSGLYIAEHYDIVTEFKRGTSQITILKKSDTINPIDIEYLNKYLSLDN